MKFQGIKRSRICSGCAQEFVPISSKQVLCKKECGKKWKTKPVRFVGVDGEAVNGKYCLLGVGDRQIENENGLNWRECFEFLYDCFQEEPKGTAFIGFYLGYDFTQILATLPAERAWYLLSREGQAKRRHRIGGHEPHPVEYDGWQFDLLANKRLRIRPKTCECRNATCKCAHKPWMYVCDVGGFWQTSFLAVIDPKQWAAGFIDAEDYASISWNKAGRSTLKLDDETRRYNRLENFYLAKVMGEICSGLEEIGIHLTPRQWFGPGQAAQAWLKSVAPSREEWEGAVPAWFVDAARMTYYGGWFEVMCHGAIQRRIYEYDINSAYPAVIATLPCLLHGKYHRGRGLPPKERQNDAICIVLGEFRSPDADDNERGGGRYTGPMPYRNAEGNISRPSIVSGWFYLEEVNASIAAGLCQPIGPNDIQEWVSYDACECESPFSSIADLYLRRLAVGKNTVLGKAAKLVYNSAYGKFAQSVGSPLFGNAIYASRITSGCRCIVLDAIATHPRKSRAVAMVATDAIFFLEPNDSLELSDRLGAWDCTVRDNLTIFKPGVYWDDTTRAQLRAASKPKFKARGINAAKFAGELWKVDHTFTGEWMTREEREWPDVVYYSDFGVVSATQALAWGKWEVAGTIQIAESVQSSNPSSKRGGLYYDRVDSVWRTEVKTTAFDYERGEFISGSHPYEKRFGTEDPFSNESREALGITEDGPVSGVFSRLLRNEEE